MKNKKFKITKEQQLKMESTAHRTAIMEAGLNINPHRVHKNKKAYSRKSKFKPSYLD